MHMPLLKKLQIENKLLKEDLNNITPSISGSGEDITLNNTANARFKTFRIGGNSYQKTTTQSKNVLDIDNYFNYNDNPSHFTYYANLIEGKTYTVRINNPEEGKKYSIKGSEHKDGFKNFQVEDLGPENQYTGTFTYSIAEENKGKKNGVVVWYPSSNELDSETAKKIQIQIEEGEVATEFKPFVPDSPSPNYSSEIRNCGDNVNLIEYPFPANQKESYTENGLDFTNKNGVIAVKGTATANENFYIYTNNSLKELKKGSYTYSISGRNIKDIRLYAYTKDWNLLNYTTDKPLIFNLEEDNEVFIYLWFEKGKTYDCIIKPKLEKGTKATSWSPYKCGSIGIKVTDDEEQEQSITFPTKERTSISQR